MRIVSEYRSANGKHALALVEYPAGSLSWTAESAFYIMQADRAGALTQARSGLGAETSEADGLRELAAAIVLAPHALAHVGGVEAPLPVYSGKPASVAAFKRYMRQPGAFRVEYLKPDSGLFPDYPARDARGGLTFTVRSGDMIEAPRGCYHTDPRAGSLYEQPDGSFLATDRPTPTRYIYEGARA